MLPRPLDPFVETDGFEHGVTRAAQGRVDGKHAHGDAKQLTRQPLRRDRKTGRKRNLRYAICVNLRKLPSILLLPCPSISTRTGDDGTTGLIFGQRVPKNHPRVEAVGPSGRTQRRAGHGQGQRRPRTHRRRWRTSSGNSSSSWANFPPTTLTRNVTSPTGVSARSNPIALVASRRRRRFALEHGDPPLRFDGWATPGRTPLAAALDLARVTARRAERHLVAMREDGPGGASAGPPVRQPRQRSSLAPGAAGGTARCRR